MRISWNVQRRAILAAFLAAALLLVPRTSAADETPEAATGTPFILTTHTGRIVTDQHFAGFFRLVFFGYSHCPDVCPTSLLTLAQVIDLLGAGADRVKPMFVTLDPERDTREVLRKYVSYFHPAIIGLTGQREMIERLARSYRIKFEKVGPARPGDDFYTIDHTASLLFMGPQGETIARFPYEMPPAEIAAKVSETLAATRSYAGRSSPR